MKLPKVYQADLYESKIYKLWEESGAFSPSKKGKPFCIVMPPPNANGALHAGHAVGYTLEDIITRYKRMQGYSTLWLPGTDHAGIETQFVFERDVLKPAGKNRFDLGAEKFYDEVMKFTLANQSKILGQMKAMGWSADWSKLKFTLDDDIIATVYDTFKKLHQDGHIYRGNRIVNWCVQCNAAFADIEIQHKMRKDKMYTLDYGTVQIATVRPETIFADSAVAVNPKDKRYLGLAGKEATIPLINRKIPVITDHRVEIAAGTGALKVTPGHDPLDYEIGQANQLPVISVIDYFGNMINVPEEYAGLGADTAREAVVKALDSEGKLVSIKEIEHAVGVHDRCGTVIEPLVSEQWFLRIKDLNQPVIKALEDDEIVIHPRRYKKIALDWLKQEHDWCISRQIWWGIRVPVYYHTSENSGKEPYIIATDENEAIRYYGKGNYRAETDTFDTWFSSGQWPFATLQNLDLFEKFYPSSLMGTATEILHKWVTRMIMFGLYRTGEVPFREVYLWGLVTGTDGSKMSKSKGNVIDPLEMTSKYGTDALRLAGAGTNTPGTNSPLSEQHIVAMRNFCNKLWNIARFIEDKVDLSSVSNIPKPVSSADYWILSELQNTSELVAEGLDKYAINQAYFHLYHFIWDDLADWYLEVSKTQTNPSVLSYVLATTLKIAHPFMPFITEAIWDNLYSQGTLLISSDWPVVAKVPSAKIKEFKVVKKVTVETRYLLKEMGSAKNSLFVEDGSTLVSSADLIKTLTRVKSVDATPVERGLRLISTDVKVWLDIDPKLAKAYLKKLHIKLDLQKKLVTNLRVRLANKAYLKSAPESVVNESKLHLKQAKMSLGQLEEEITNLEKSL